MGPRCCASRAGLARLRVHPHHVDLSNSLLPLPPRHTLATPTPKWRVVPPIFPLPALPSLIRSTSWEEPLRDVPLARVGRACPDHPLAPLRPIYTSTSPRALLLLLFPALAVQRAPLCDTHACATPMPVRHPCPCETHATTREPPVDAAVLSHVAQAGLSRLPLQHTLQCRWQHRRRHRTHYNRRLSR